MKATGGSRTSVRSASRPPRASTAAPPPIRRRVVRVGDRLGPYRLCIKIGEGGMGSVYLARSASRAGRHRFVALKCIREPLARDKEFVDMFFDEARIASRIVHPNVCSVLDFDARETVPYLVMEHLAGETMAALRRRLAEESGLFEPRQRAGLVARLMADTCEGLHAVHEGRDVAGEPMNVVHRDVCPDNLLVTYDGSVKILDFGVARSSDQRHRTRTGVVKGKFSYLAPELLVGSDPDRRADIWSLGVVAWELLTGERLFRGASDIETLRAVDTREIVPPSKVSAGVPELLDEIVLGALCRDPEKRCDDARELGRLFTQFLVEQQLAVGLAELADSMELLFPQGRACARQLYDVAEQIDSDPEIPLLPIDALGAELVSDELDLIIEEGDPIEEDEQTSVRPRSRLLELLDGVTRRWRGLSNAVAATVAVTLVALAAFQCGSREATPPRDAPELQPKVAPARSPYRVEVLPGDDGGRDIILRLRLDEPGDAPPAALRP